MGLMDTVSAFKLSGGRLQNRPNLRTIAQPARITTHHYDGNRN